MWVLIVSDCTTGGGKALAGEVRNLPDADAESLIALGSAVEAKIKRKQPRVRFGTPEINLKPWHYT